MAPVVSPPRHRTAERAARFRAPGAPTAVVGHMGAPLQAPANTTEAFRAAASLGADGIELDLVAVEPGRVIVAHDLGDARRRPDALLLETLEHVLAEPPLAELPVLLDVKSTGAERALAAALVGARLTPRAIISTTDPAVLRALARAAPRATRSLTYPRSRRDPRRHALARTLADLRRPIVRRTLPLVVRRSLQRHALNAITVDHQLVTPALRRLTARRGIELIVWTVDDPARARELLALDVDAIITNDPQLVLRLRDEHQATGPKNRGVARGGW
ncbi:MAG: glycerophosphodiester phosphodiesterase [Patulibacter minatonensis]